MMQFSFVFLLNRLDLSLSAFVNTRRWRCLKTWSDGVYIRDLDTAVELLV